MLPDETLLKIIEESEERIYQEDSVIVKEHDLIKGIKNKNILNYLGIYVIVRGSGTESSSAPGVNYKEKKGKYEIISI